MKTLGQVLRSYREKKQMTVGGLSRRTAIPVQVIENLEAENYTSLPAAPLVRGYVLLLAQETGISEETALALYRRDVDPTLSHTTQLPRRLRRGWKLKNLIFTPRFLSLLALIAITLLGTLYASWQWFALSQPPSLSVSQPTNQETLTSPVTVTGSTSPDNTVTINTEVITLDLEGNFRYDLPLPPGERAIVITAEDSRGRRAEKILFVTVE